MAQNFGSRVLCLQDITKLDYNGQQMAGLWPLSYEDRHCLYLHRPSKCDIVEPLHATWLSGDGACDVGAFILMEARLVAKYI